MPSTKKGYLPFNRTTWQHPSKLSVNNKLNSHYLQRDSKIKIPVASPLALARLRGAKRGINCTEGLKAYAASCGELNPQRLNPEAYGIRDRLLIILIVNLVVNLRLSKLL